MAKQKQKKSTRPTRTNPVPKVVTGRVRIDYQSTDEGSELLDTDDLSERICEITELGGYGPTYGSLMCILESFYEALRMQFGSYVRRVEFELPKDDRFSVSSLSITRSK